ncbi:uncharacterized protein K02A2.6-like [Colletes gigas]|uniref:uncharacterized protein K02A2.6-like n=1 Tax=Colletes gigas TaxID=935657 RepID=UPI001C9ADBC1|nr:uncharacterized protein K02A2.6-like [Colletes gigas]
MATANDDLKSLTSAIQSLLQLQIQQSSAGKAGGPPQIDAYNQLSARIEKYTYGTAEDTKPFRKWLLRHEFTICTEAACLSPEMRTRLVLDKLGQSEFDRLVDHVAPLNPSEMSQENLLEVLKELFRDKVSSFCYSSEHDELKRIALRVVEKNREASLKDVVTELEAYLNISSSMKTLENPLSAVSPSVLKVTQPIRYDPKVPKRLIDLSEAFMQLEIDEAHREITTITTPKGLFRFKRLPFGIKTAPAIFQQAMDSTLSGLEGVYAYLDDVIVVGCNRQEHDERLVRTLQRLEEKGWKLSFEKCFFTVQQIKYLGLIVNKHGISADPEATRAIASMPNPKNVSEVQSLLGLVNHYGKFIPYLHEIKRPLEELTRKNKLWMWNKHHDAAMEKIKNVMLSPLLLEHYDPTKTLIVAADASSTGIGAVLLQRDSNGHERAVYHMSRSLTDSQRNYSQLEKEALALVTGVERFHKFVWGRRFVLQTDHKPLVALLQTENTKGLRPTTAARLKRWALRLLGYDFKIEYIRTQDFGQADALSRLMVKFRQDNAEELQVAGVQEVEKELLQVRNTCIDSFGKEIRGKLKKATEDDSILTAVFKAIREGWSSTGNPESLQHYQRRADQLAIVDGTLLLSDRIVIPDKLRPAILTALHRGHPGIRRMKQLAREYVYWPKMSGDIEQLVRQCDPCALTQKLPRKVPLNPWPVPSRPLERVHLDFAGPIDGKYILIFVDAYSKYLDVSLSTSISASRTVEMCREIFARYGAPEVIVTDHGTQFTAEVFAVFCREMQCTHLLSAINHPQSNGQAERMVDTVKRAIAKDPTNWKKQLYEFLYSYRYSPCSATDTGKSPAEIFFGRRMNTPFTKLFPKFSTGEHSGASTPAIRRGMKQQFNRHHGTIPRQLSVGDRVVVLTSRNKREQGEVWKILSKTRYTVRLDNGKVVDRHINHIWRGGCGTAKPRGGDEIDNWGFYEPPPNTSSVPQTVPDTGIHLNTSQETQLSGNQHFEEAVTQPASTRPTRLRAPVRRLMLDPASKSYLEC